MPQMRVEKFGHIRIQLLGFRRIRSMLGERSKKILMMRLTLVDFQLRLYACLSQLLMHAYGVG